MKRKSFNSIDTYVINQFRKNPHRSISGCLRSVKKQKRFFGKGDYVYLADIILAIGTLGIIPSKNQIRHAFNQSPELSKFSKGSKTKLLNQLIKLSPVVTKPSEISQRQNENKKMTHTSSMKGNH